MLNALIPANYFIKIPKKFIFACLVGFFSVFSAHKSFTLSSSIKKCETLLFFLFSQAQSAEQFFSSKPHKAWTQNNIKLVFAAVCPAVSHFPFIVMTHFQSHKFVFIKSEKFVSPFFVVIYGVINWSRRALFFLLETLRRNLVARLDLCERHKGFALVFHKKSKSFCYSNASHPFHSHVVINLFICRFDKDATSAMWTFCPFLFVWGFFRALKKLWGSFQRLVKHLTRCQFQILSSTFCGFSENFHPNPPVQGTSKSSQPFTDFPTPRL